MMDNILLFSGLVAFSLSLGAHLIFSKQEILRAGRNRLRRRITAVVGDDSNRVEQSLANALVGAPSANKLSFENVYMDYIADENFAMNLEASLQRYKGVKIDEQVIRKITEYDYSNLEQKIVSDSNGDLLIRYYLWKRGNFFKTKKKEFVKLMHQVSSKSLAVGEDG